MKPSIYTTNSDIEFQKLPKTLYAWEPKLWSNKTIVFPQEFIIQLEGIVESYLRVMWLSSQLYPARVDIWLSWYISPIIYEITTGFVDQIGSCLTLQEALEDTNWLNILSQTPFDSSILTTEPYRKEFELTQSMFQKAWKKLNEKWNSCFVYWYPTEEMKDNDMYIPGWKWLDAEQKLTQTKILSRISEGTDFIIPRLFSNYNTPYSTLPDDKYSRLIFKQDSPKLKGWRNTVLFGKWKESEERYKNWEMFAQEYMSPYRTEEGNRYELKALFMPTSVWTQFLWAYNLSDNNKEDTNFWNTTIPNDGYPQWPVLIR